MSTEIEIVEPMSPESVKIEHDDLNFNCMLCQVISKANILFQR